MDHLIEIIYKSFAFVLWIDYNEYSRVRLLRIRISYAFLLYFTKRFLPLNLNRDTAYRDVVPNPTDDDGVEISPPSHGEVKVAIMRLKNIKRAGTDGLPFFNCLRPDVMS